MHIERLTADQQ